MQRIELAREEDKVRGRSGGGAGGARLQPNREVRIASSESWTPGGIGDDRELSVVGVAGGSSRWSAMEGVGRVMVVLTYSHQRSNPQRHLLSTQCFLYTG